MTGLAEQLKARLRQDLKAAMQARQSTDAKLLRVILAAIDNAEALPVVARPQTQATRFTDGSAEAPRRDLSSHELGQVLEAEIAARLAAAEHYDRLARPEEATRLRAETEIVRRYLSKG